MAHNAKWRLGLALLCASPVAMASFAAIAQPAPMADAAPAKGMRGGDVTLADFIMRREQRMMAADTDHDGRISKAEFLATAQGEKGDADKRFARMDADGDGYIDKAEMDAVLTKAFNRLDTNGDGVLSMQERMAAREMTSGGSGAEPAK